MSVQDELDLHGVKLEQAVLETKAFLDASCSAGLKKIRIITGKGIHSPGGKSVIRPEILYAVKNHPGVREFNDQPKAKDGGSGAIIIILKAR